MEENNRSGSLVLAGLGANQEKPFTDIPLRDIEHGSGRDGSASSSSSGKNSQELQDVQAGVRNIEAVSMTWTKWGLIAAYLSIFLMAFTTSLEGQVVLSLSVFATSSFGTHSLISTVYVVQGVVNAVVKSPMAKVADVFGRLEAFCFSMFIFVIGYVQMAASTNVQTYAAAQIFYSAGFTGLQILQQIFIADTSDLTNRAIWSTLPDLPYLVTVWIGPLISQSLLPQWRWGYGMWCIILPITFAPLAITLFLNNRKAKKLGLTVPRPWAGLPAVQILKNLWFELDIGGILLLSGAFALILIPLTIASRATDGWRTASIIVMLVLGFVCFILFPVWESSKKAAPRPLIPLHLLKSRTFCAGCAVGFFYFMAFYLSVQPYFYSYLLVVQGQSVAAAGHVTQTFSFTSSITSLIISFIIKYTKHYKWFVTGGAFIYLMALGLIFHYRTMNVSIAQIVGTQICLGIGGGMLNVPAQIGVQASTDHQHVAIATAVYLTSVEIGGAVGSAISGAVWGNQIPGKLEQYLPAAVRDQAHAIYNSVDVARSYPMGSPERLAIARAYQETMTNLLTIALCISVPCVIASLFMKNYKLDEMEQNVKGRVIGGGTKEGREVEVLREEPGAENSWSKMGQWLQWPLMKKKVATLPTDDVSK